MNLNVEGFGQAALLIVKGEMTADDVAMLKKAVDHQLEDENVLDLVFDMQEVPFVDSEVWELLLDLQDELAERMGQVKLARCDENVRKIAEMTRLDREFELFDAVEPAVRTITA
jgi:anti-anti-sigma factor